MTTATRPTTGVSRTAVIIAQARATEDARPDRLFTDPLAADLVEAVGWIQVADAGRMNQEYFALRTRFFDDHLQAAAAAGCTQVVLLAAGLDTRAFRLTWPDGTQLFEVDLPGLVAFKEAVLRARRAAPACDRVVLPVDLREDWRAALVDAGFDPEQPTAWLVEGLLMYLDTGANDTLLAEIGEVSAPGSRLGFEHANQAYVDLPQMQEVWRRLERFNATWSSTLDDPVAWAARHGWDAQVTTADELAVRHGRPVPPLTDPTRVGDARMWLVEATRSDG